MIKEEYERFLANQKNEWLSKSTNKGKFSEADERYHPELWFAKATKNARYGVTTHTSTFTHPDAKVTPILFSKARFNNGYLTSNNVNMSQSFDVFGNAATDTIVKETYLFLTKKLANGNTIWQQFRDETDAAKVFVRNLNQDFEKAYSNLNKIFVNQNEIMTTGRLKQVYFPIEKVNYHLLSLVISSPMITELVKRVDKIRFDESIKEAKECRKKQQYYEGEYNDLLNLTQVGFGGSKPQNVSVLNSQNAGRAYLLSSCPPILEKRMIRLPRTDFFAQCLYRKNYQESFMQLHKFMQLDLNNIDIRTAIHNIIQFVIDQVLLQAFKIRETYPKGWSNQDYYADLPKLQRLWLDQIYEVDRETQTEWRDEISHDIARWISRSYEKEISDHYTLGTGELLDVKQRVEKSLQQAKEFF